MFGDVKIVRLLVNAGAKVPVHFLVYAERTYPKKRDILAVLRAIALPWPPTCF
jgi:hypothetical protein